MCCFYLLLGHPWCKACGRGRRRRCVQHSADVLAPGTHNTGVDLHVAKHLSDVVPEASGVVSIWQATIHSNGRQGYKMWACACDCRQSWHADQAYCCTRFIQQQHRDDARIARQHSIGDVEVEARGPRVHQVWQLLQGILKVGVAHLQEYNTQFDEAAVPKATTDGCRMQGGTE